MLFDLLYLEISEVTFHTRCVIIIIISFLKLVGGWYNSFASTSDHVYAYQSILNIILVTQIGPVPIDIHIEGRFY